MRTTTTIHSPRWLAPQSIRAALVLSAIAAGPIGLVAWLQTQNAPDSGNVAMLHADLIDAIEPESYATLEEMTQSADAVVHAQVVEVRPGQVEGPPGDGALYYAWATVRIIETLSGSLPGGTQEVTLELPMFSGPAHLDAMVAGLPWDESVYFLRSTRGEATHSSGLPRGDPRAEDTYYRLVVLAGFIVNDGGHAAVSQGSPALEGLEGRPFPDVVSIVRDATSQ